MGTAIHKAAQVTWEESIAKGQRILNETQAKDAAIAEYQELLKDGLQFDEDENQATSEREILKGTEAFLTDIAVYVPIPKAVEQRFTVPLTNPLVKELSGTVDYITDDTIADLKTSKRKPVAASYVTQQSLYRLLAEENGVKVKHNNIQGVILKSTPEGIVLPLESNMPQARQLVNSMLDTLAIAARGEAPLEVLFRGNPKYYLCDKKYCALYNACPYVKGEQPKGAL